VTGVAGWHLPPPQGPRRSAKTTAYEGFTYIQDVFLTGTDTPGVAVPPCHPPGPTKHFTAHTCRKCSAITITGTTYGLRVDLEPQVLTDETEYAALLADTPTYDLWPDRTARRRHLEEISHPERVPRHAHHTCGTTYGTLPRPTPPTTSQANATGPAPF